VFFLVLSIVHIHVLLTVLRVAFLSSASKSTPTKPDAPTSSDSNNNDNDTETVLVEFAAGTHALSIAAGCGHYDLVQWLVYQGADMNQR
jgi:hypothetical protein